MADPAPQVYKPPPIKAPDVTVHPDAPKVGVLNFQPSGAAQRQNPSIRPISDPSLYSSGTSEEAPPQQPKVGVLNFQPTGQAQRAAPSVRPVQPEPPPGPQAPQAGGNALTAQQTTGAPFDMGLNVQKKVRTPAGQPLPGLTGALAPTLAKKGGPTPWLNPKEGKPTPEREGDVRTMPHGGIAQVHPNERALSVSPILYGDTPAQKPRSRKVPDVAAELQGRGRAALEHLGIQGGRINGPDPHHDEMLSRIIAHEVSHSLMSRGGDAHNWYTGSVEEAMRVAHLLHPEMASNSHSSMAYKLALAITSQGEKVPSNVRLADKVFEHFKTHANEPRPFPENIVSKAGEPMNNNMRKLNDIVEKHGLAGLEKFLHTQFTVGELRKNKILNDEGVKISGENVGTKVHGSAILGPKIGNGFYQNLRGNYDPVTMDLWFMRGWNRLTGNLVGQKSPEAAEKTRQRYLKVLGKDAPDNDEDLFSLAQIDHELHEENFQKHRADYDSGARKKSERTLAATRLLESMAGVNQMPTSGGQRDWMRSVVNRSREILAEKGHHITNADLQALWWYPEKELYAKLGGRDSEGLNVNYSSALQELAKEKGLTPEDIQRAVKGK